MSDIQPGIYKGRVVAGSAQYGHTKNGTEQIALDLDIPSLGRTLTTFLYFSDAATPFSLDRLKACGWTGANVLDLTGIETKEVSVQVRYEEWQGQQQLRVEIMTGGGKVELSDQMNDTQRRAFGARMAQFMKGTGQAAPAPRAPNAQPQHRTTQAAPPPQGDDDIPF